MPQRVKINKCINLQFLLILLCACSLVLCRVKREYSKLNGEAHNDRHQDWGKAGEPLYNQLPTSFKNGKDEIIDAPSAREISNAILGIEPEVRTNDRGVSDLHTSFGQFLAHDMVLTASPTEDEDKQQITIDIPRGDPWFDPFFEGNKTFTMTRSRINKFLSKGRRRKIVNHQTSALDLSQVYGFGDRAIALRNATDFAKLAVWRNKAGEEFPIKNMQLLPNDNDAGVVPDKELFVAGDVRMNENPGLATLHTIWLREHNRIVDELRKEHDDDDDFKDDEFVYQEARRLNIAYWQAIVYNEYMIVTLGAPLDKYTGYKPDVKLDTSNFFSSVAFRYGHSETSPIIARADEQRNFVDPILLRDAFFNFPGNGRIWPEQGVDPILRGVTSQTQQTVDVAYVDDIRNFLFGRPGFGGIDLGAFNIMRGREHGAATYNQARQFFKLKPASKFSDITSDEKVWRALQHVYRNNIHKVDAYVGGLAEEHEMGNVGPLFAAAIRDQYIRLRDGDRFYFENPQVGFSEEVVANISRTRIADVILRNTNIQRIQCSAFYVSTSYDCEKPVEVDPTKNTTNSSDPNAKQFVGGDISISWEFLDAGAALQFTLTGATTGWVGMGIGGDAGSMLGADAFIGSVQGSSASIIDYQISARRAGCPGVCQDSSNDLELIEGTEADGTTTLIFKRNLDTGDGDDYVISDGETTNVIFAYGSSESVSYHGSSKESATINFFTGDTATVSDVVDDANDRITVHGVLMFIGWAVLAPIGILLARFGKHFAFIKKWWFHMHLLIQYLAALFIITGFCLVLEATAALGHDHLEHDHGKMGLAAVIFAIVVPASGQIFALFFEHQHSRFKVNLARVGVKKKIALPINYIFVVLQYLHYLLGYVSPIFATIVMFYGLHEKDNSEVQDVDWYWWFLVALWYFFIYLTYFVLFIYDLIVRYRNSDHPTFIHFIYFDIIACWNRGGGGGGADDMDEDDDDDDDDEEWSDDDDIDQ